MDYYGTLGPSCQREEILRELFLSGMTGLRINLSHGGLAGRREEIRAAQRAAREAGTEAKLLTAACPQSTEGLAAAVPEGYEYADLFELVERHL